MGFGQSFRQSFWGRGHGTFRLNVFSKLSQSARKVFHWDWDRPPPKVAPRRLALEKRSTVPLWSRRARMAQEVSGGSTVTVVVPVPQAEARTPRFWTVELVREAIMG